jgi:hypothetical protein
MISAPHKGWSLTQNIDIRVGAIEYIRTIQKGSSETKFFNKFWSHWVATYGADLGEACSREERESYQQVSIRGQKLEVAA